MWNAEHVEPHDLKTFGNSRGNLLMFTTGSTLRGDMNLSSSVTHQTFILLKRTFHTQGFREKDISHCT